MLLDIAAPLEVSPLTESPSDCRVYERRPCEVPTICQPASLLAMKEAGWTALIRDISQGGVRLHVPRRFEKGTPLAIELPGDQDHEASIVFVNVVFVKRGEDGLWVLGCKFVCELNDDEMRRLLTFDPSAPRATRPTAGNRTVSNVQFELTVNGGCQVRGCFQSFNATQGWPLKPGKVVRLKGRNGDQGKWSCQVRVVECKEEASTWHLRATLLQTPSMTELLQALGCDR